MAEFTQVTWTGVFLRLIPAPSSWEVKEIVNRNGRAKAKGEKRLHQLIGLRNNDWPYIGRHCPIKVL